MTVRIGLMCALVVVSLQPSDVVRTFRSAVMGRPEGLHYIRSLICG